MKTLFASLLLIVSLSVFCQETVYFSEFCIPQLRDYKNEQQITKILNQLNPLTLRVDKYSRKIFISSEKAYQIDDFQKILSVLNYDAIYFNGGIQSVDTHHSLTIPQWNKTKINTATEKVFIFLFKNDLKPILTEKLDKQILANKSINRMEISNKNEITFYTTVNCNKQEIKSIIFNTRLDIHLSEIVEYYITK